MNLFFLLLPLAQVAPADTATLIGRNGWVGIVVVLCGVIVYLSRRIEKLQEQILALTAKSKEEIVEIQRTHAAELTRMMTARLEDLETVTDAVKVLDGVSDRMADRGPTSPPRRSRTPPT